MPYNNRHFSNTMPQTLNQLGMGRRGGMSQLGQQRQYQPPQVMENQYSAPTRVPFRGSLNHLRSQLDTASRRSWGGYGGADGTPYPRRAQYSAPTGEPSSSSLSNLRSLLGWDSSGGSLSPKPTDPFKMQDVARNPQRDQNLARQAFNQKQAQMRRSMNMLRKQRLQQAAYQRRLEAMRRRGLAGASDFGQPGFGEGRF